LPINQAPAYDPGHGWLGAAETLLLTLSEFRQQAGARRKSIADGKQAVRRGPACPVASRQPGSRAHV
jgi:hypothetical protein